MPIPLLRGDPTSFGSSYDFTLSPQEANQPDLDSRTLPNVNRHSAGSLLVLDIFLAANKQPVQPSSGPDPAGSKGSEDQLVASTPNLSHSNSSSALSYVSSTQPPSFTSSRAADSATCVSIQLPLDMAMPLPLPLPSTANSSDPLISRRCACPNLFELADDGVFCLREFCVSSRLLGFIRKGHWCSLVHQVTLSSRK
ncbi:unnamed protein product [Protopolystoma xenopodis]|uniref:Uncharacterized protein n=1 Tax=Protopolystoma xenopodis TaxID=117903 RepID=A0A3S5FC53_9PLAT|nr:unnamed protein product [Protopolystoma xenopodis]